MLISFGVVVGYLYSGTAAVVLVAGVGLALLTGWLVIPLLTHLTDRDGERAGEHNRRRDDG